jgi:LmbE family N-acetylglucosaminyl deacetylase
MRVLGELALGLRVRYYIVHGAYEYPLPKGYWPALPLYPAPRGRGMPWRRVELTPEQVDRKAAAIRAHASQVSVMRRFLLSFARRNELVSAVPIPVRHELDPVERDLEELSEPD